MRLVILASRSSIHTVRWVNALSDRGHDVHLLTMHSGGDALHEGVHVHQLPIPAPLGYFLNIWNARHLLRKLRPDLLHAHYAGGYGLLGRLCGYHPYLLSVWGRDVYDVPHKSPLHRRLVVANLRAADHVCSTSQAMAEQTLRLYPKLNKLSVTPFGIDTERFQPQDRNTDKHVVTIGTVKTLRSKYGIDVLLEAFAAVYGRLNGSGKDEAIPLRLLIVGEGGQRPELEARVHALGLTETTTFTGKVPHAEVPEHLNRLDIYVAPSRLDSESFGVAVIEASACECPVIVSDAGGLPEVVEDGVTGFVVERENVEATAEAILKLIKNSSLRHKMGAAGRRRVLEHYDWEENVTRMECVYQTVKERTGTEVATSVTSKY